MIWTQPTSNFFAVLITHNNDEEPRKHAPMGPNPAYLVLKISCKTKKVTFCFFGLTRSRGVFAGTCGSYRDHFPIFKKKQKSF